MPKLSDAELEEFFRWREGWKEGEPLHPRTRDVAESHILPKLGDGRKANLQRSGVPEEQAAASGAAFWGDVKKFLRDEHLKYAQQGEEESDDEPSDPATHAKKGPRKRHLTHRDEVINTIVTAMFRPKSKFEYRSVPQSILYFACMAADENAVLALIEPPEKRVERKRGIKTDSLGECKEQGHEVSDEASPHFPRPEKVVNTVARQAQIRGVLKKKADKWLVLALLFEVGEYSWREIASALQGKSPPEGWAQAGQRGSTQPRNPANVWDDIKSGFDLPDWNTVRGWFPPPTPNEEALRVFYCRGAQELRKKLADV
jgi:hypothetical protein